MKRYRSDGIGERVRPPGWSSSHQEPRLSDSDEDSPTPARKILKTLLENEVDRAIRDLDKDTTSSGRVKNHRAASLIPEFDPEGEDCTVSAWLKKIDQLGDIHDWNDKIKAFHLQDKLRGQARKWYNRLEEYDYSWNEWKQMLLRAFPKHRDYSTLLDEMMQRKKLPHETMTKYYQDKVSMCFRCKLSDSASVSCIIRGLPSSLQPNARAFQCERPDELYEAFLCALDDYKGPTPEVRGVFKDARSPQVPEKKINPETDPCPRCKKTGHMLRNCTLSDQRVCFKCGAQGHIATRCPSSNTHSKVPASVEAKSNIKDIKVLQNYSDVYKKVAKVNGVFVKAYIDTGSQVNVMNGQISKLLSLRVEPTSTILKGFSGGLITSRGEVEFNLEVDDIQIQCKAHLTDIDMGGISLLIGQPVINDKNMLLIVKNGTATLKREPELATQFDVAEDLQKFKVVTSNQETLPPGASIIKVQVLGNREDNDVCTAARLFEFEGVSYSLPATLLQGSEGHIKVINTGDQNVVWKAGQILTRAESCEEFSKSNQVSCQAMPFLTYEPKLSCPLNSNSSISLPTILTMSQTASLSIGGVQLADIKIGKLKENEHSKLTDLLLKYKDSFASSTKDLGCTNLVQMKIKLTTDQPIYRQPYRLSHSEQEIVKSKVAELLDAGIIKESESNYASPVILVKKKNGDSRLCVDYRALNAITVKDRYPLPNIEDHISKLAGKKYFTCLDMAQGYHQLQLRPEDTHKSSFICQQGQFEYLRVPFGLANSPSVFMRLINKIVSSIQNCQTDNDSSTHEILAFLDDLLLPSVDVETGLKMLEIVLQKFKSENLKLNMKKCSFLQSRVTYLGHEISQDGIQPAESKLTAVSEFPIPKSVHEIRQFIGLCSYFRKFIYKFAQIARPLTDLTKQNVPWDWGCRQIASFDELKKCLCSKPVLALYDPALRVEIHTDACKLGIAGILLQQQTDETLRPVMYFSRVTSKQESVYHSYELETLAVVESLRKFRIYIVGKHVKIVTDCTAVRATLTKRDIIPRIARWWLLIQDYDISVEYRPGERMRHVDALSRNPIDVMNINRLEVTDWFYTVQSQDDKLKNIIDQLKSGSAELDITNNYAIIDDRLYRKTLNGNRLVVPGPARWKIVQMHHDEIGHVGLKRCTELIKNDFWFSKMTRFIRKYVTACLHCAYGKGEHGKKEGKLHPIPKPTEPFRMIHVDHLGPFCRTKKGHEYMLVITDAFSKFVIAEPTRTVNSVETIRVLKRIFGLFGYPDRVVTDHGKAFTSRYFKKFGTDKQFKHTLNAIACPRANGQVERTNRTILNALRATDPSEAANNWANCLPDVVWGINNTLNDTTGLKPYDLMFSRSGRSVCDVSIPGRVVESTQSKRAKATSRIEKASAKMKRNFDKRRKNCKVYNKGDLVLWRQAPTSSVSRVNTKLDDIYSGPYIIFKVVGNDRYRIRSIKGLRGYKSFMGLVSADSLRPYRSIAPVSDSASSSDEQLETDDLIDLLES